VDEVGVDQAPAALTAIEVVIIGSALFGMAFTVTKALLENRMMRRTAEAPIRERLNGYRPCSCR